MLSGAQRIVAGTVATLSWQGVDQDGEPGDPGTVTVAVTRSDGTALTGLSVAGTGVAKRTVTLTSAQTALLDVLTAVWSSGGTVVGKSTHEIVGGVYVTSAEARGIEPSLADVGQDSKATFLRARSEVEAMFEQVTGQAFVPRFSIVTGSAAWPYVQNLRSVRWMKARSWATGEYASWAPTDYRTASVFDDEYDIVVGVEHGMDSPPMDVKRAAVTAIRYQINAAKTGIDARAMTFQPMDGGNVTLATPGLGPWVTGIPQVDEVLKRYTVPERPGLLRMTPSVKPRDAFRYDWDGPGWGAL